MVTFASQRKPRKVEPGHAEPNRAESTCSQIDWVRFGEPGANCETTPYKADDLSKVLAIL